MDDGSKDRTPEIADQLAERYDNITVIHQQNGGPNAARKTGAKAVRGDYVVVVDGDDWIPRDYLERFARVIWENHSDMILCGYQLVTPNGSSTFFPPTRREWKGSYNREELEKEILTDLFAVIPAWTKAIKREPFVEAQLMVDDMITIGEDGCVVYPVIAKANGVTVLDDLYYCYRWNPNSITNSKKKIVTWENFLWRLAYYQENLPIDQFDMKDQLASFAAHMMSNVIMSNFRQKPFGDVKKKANSILALDWVKPYFSHPLRHGTPKEKTAGFLIRHRMYGTLKILSAL